MTARSVGIIRTRRVLRLRGKDLLAFFIIASIIPVYAVDLLLPPHFKGVIAMLGLFSLCVYYICMKKHVDTCAIIWGIYMVWLCVSNFYNSRDLLNSILYPAKVILFILINKAYLDKRDATLLKFMRHYLTLLIVITFLIQMIDQDLYGYTASQNYLNFFESDNYLGWYYVPYICLCVILDFIEKDRIRTITFFEIALCTASILRAWVGKVIIALTLVILYILFVYRRKIAKAFRPKLLVIGYAVVNIGVVFFGMQRFVTTSLYDLLGKDNTISGRTFIWASAIQNFRESPFFGHGVDQGGELPINRVFSNSLMPAHNIFLEIAVQAGTVGLILYVVILLVSFAAGRRRYMKNIRYQQHSYEYLFLYFIIFIMFFMAIFSHPVLIPFFYFPLILLTSFDSLVDMHIKYGSSDHM